MKKVRRFVLAGLAGGSLMLASGAAHAEDISGVIVRTLILSENSRLVGDVTCTVSGAPCIAFGAPNISFELLSSEGFVKQRTHLIAALPVALLLTADASAQSTATKYVRYSMGGRTSYGVLEGDVIRELKGDLFQSPTPTGKTVRLSDVKLMAPVEPSKVLLVGRNYRARLEDEPPDKEPTLSSKVPTSIIGPEESIIFPPGATNVHYGCDLVIVIGKRAKNVSVMDAPQYIFGVTAGNDVTEREWQRTDLRYFRSKAADTFGPIGPVIARGLNYNDLKLEARINGEVQQSARTKEMIFGVETVVSYISQYVTLMPGDVIFTGTPRTSQAIKPGDTVEIELEGVGVLRNKVVGPTTSSSSGR